MTLRQTLPSHFSS